MTSPIRTEGLTRRFGDREAIRDLDLTVNAGSIYGLIGPNGAGKTTTIRTLINLLSPSHGRASVLGVDSRRLGRDELARIGYVGDLASLPGWMTTDQLIRYTRRFYPTWDGQFEAELLRDFRLPGDRKVGRLSRGEKAKLALLLAMAPRPELLLLDEPFSGLDPLVREEISQGALALTGDAGWTILIASHDIAEVERLVDHVGFIEGGRLCFSESLVELQTRCQEVQVILAGNGAAPVDAGEPWPGDWLDIQRSGRVARFLDRNYSAERSAAEIRRRFTGVERIDAAPASLERIFLAHARAGRKGIES